MAKLLLIGLVDGIAIWAGARMWNDRAWNALAATVVVACVATYVYLSPRRIPAKYLIPGTAFLLLFQVYPVGYTAYTAFTNYGTGNVLTKAQAIKQIVGNSRVEGENAPSYTMDVYANGGGSLRYVFTNEETGDRLVSDGRTIEPLDETQATIADGIVTALGDYRRLSLREKIDRQAEIGNLLVKTPDGEVRAESLSSASVSLQRLRYDKARDRIVDVVDGTEYRAESGTFVSADGSQLKPGFRAVIGARNFSKLFTNAQIRGPFVRVFIWTYVFAAGTVLLAFSLGLLLAMALNHPRLRFRSIYRVLLVVPYAMPAFMMILIWNGMLNTNYGVINSMFGTHIDWLNDPWLARASILLVNLWLGFPYMFLITTGALQSVPDDIREAARVDGATGLQTFRKVVLPLLLTAVAPLLVASFAFNFNNFGPIFFLTGGGPPIPRSQSIAGQTDILITYTYKVAFASGRGSDYGFASALATVIFLLVGTLSIFNFRLTKQFEELQ